MVISDSKVRVRNKSKTYWLYAMVLLYLAGGVNHFINPGTYLPIMMPWLPLPIPLIYLSGALEILFGALLISLATRRIASIGIILLLIAIFPANIQMTLNYFHDNNPYAWLTVLRLPVQFILIRWAYRFYKRPGLVRLL